MRFTIFQDSRQGDRDGNESEQRTAADHGDLLAQPKGPALNTVLASANTR